MKQQYIHLLTTSIVCICALCIPLTSNAHNLPDFAKLVAENAAAVVNISSTVKRAENANNSSPRQNIPNIPNIPQDSPFYDFFQKFFGAPQEDIPFRRGPSLGSGFIISQDGYIITNHHVISEADQILVRLNDRQEFVAELIGSDKRSDIAVLKIAADNLPILQLGSSTDLQVGEWVLAIGSPFGLDYSVTQGIISAIERNLPNENYVPFIQTDVAINPGNSGGPLFNMAGEVIGVNSQIYSRTGGFMGLSFAVPINVVKNVYRQILDKGYVSRGWLGVLIQNVTTELAESFAMSRPHGALVAKVLPGSPAEKAGLEVGDIIIEYASRDILMSSDLPPMVGRTAVGETVSLRVIRNGKKITLKLTLAELPQEDEAKFARRDSRDKLHGMNDLLRIRVADIDQEKRAELSLPEHGVLVVEVMDGPAQAANILTGDVILLLDNKKVKNVQHFTKIVNSLSAAKSVPILIQRRGNPIFLALKLPTR